MTYRKNYIISLYKINNTKKINIVTNGFFTEKIIDVTSKILAECSVDLNIQISLDGLEKTHDKIRRISIFKNAVSTARKLKEMSLQAKNLHVTIQTTISKQNLKEIIPLAEYVKRELQAVHHGFQFVRSASFDVYQIDQNFLSGLDPKLKRPLLTIKELEEAFKDFSQFSNSDHSLLSSYVRIMNKHIIQMKKEKRPFVKCLAGKYDAVIWPEGSVSLCEFTKPFANLSHYDFNFYLLWTSKKAEEAKNKIKACFCTHTCNLLNAMQFNENALNEVLAEK